jgi:hypothetical protein
MLRHVIARFVRSISDVALVAGAGASTTFAQDAQISGHHREPSERELIPHHSARIAAHVLKIDAQIDRKRGLYGANQ